MAAGNSKKQRIIIIGAGFGGLRLARALNGTDYEVFLIDKHNYHQFQPLMYQVATARLEPSSISFPLRKIFQHSKNVNIRIAEIQKVDTDKKILSTTVGDLPYDRLIIALGCTTNYFGNTRIQSHSFPMKSVPQAMALRNRILKTFEDTIVAGPDELQSLLNFIIVGGGPTGVEIAGAISDISKLYMRHDFRHIDPAKARVILIEGSPRILAAYPEDLSKKAVEQLAQLGVEVYTGQSVMEVQPGYVVVGGKRVNAVVTIWAAGVQASPLGKMLGTPTDRRGCAIVDIYLNPPGHPDIFVCGDLAHVEEDGRQVPGVAQPAMQMGRHAAQMIAQDMAGKPRTKFHYFDKGDMATIGRHAAVANVRWPIKAHWSGTLAWLSWVSVHLFFLVGFRNRLAVFFSWAWTYLTFNRGARLITGSPLLPGWGQQAGIRPQVILPPMDTTSPMLGPVPDRPKPVEEPKAAVN